MDKRRTDIEEISIRFTDGSEIIVDHNDERIKYLRYVQTQNWRNKEDTHKVEEIWNEHFIAWIEPLQRPTLADK